MERRLDRLSGNPGKAVVHERIRGGQPGNTNSQKRIQLPAWLDLSHPESIRKFLREIVVPSAISGKLGVRTVTAITSICKVLLDSEQGEIIERLEQRLDVLEQRGGHWQSKEEVAAEFVNQLPNSLRDQILEYGRQKAKEESGELNASNQ